MNPIGKTRGEMGARGEPNPKIHPNGFDAIADWLEELAAIGTNLDAAKRANRLAFVRRLVCRQ